MGFLFLPFTISAQEFPVDSLSLIDLNEVIVISPKTRLDHQKQRKPLSGLDQFLESSRQLQMVKRGAYAWEPGMNGMTSERLTVTIDGMQIFGACTDKMDPITSYVDVSNLSEVEIGSGQQGAAFGNSLGGAVNLALKKDNFGKKGWSGNLETSFESNNRLRVAKGALKYADEKFYFFSDALFRKAEDYKAGGNEAVAFSQFEKYNFSVRSGYRPAEGKMISTAIIFDKAVDVGYPALPMDVSLAQAGIFSLSYEQEEWGSLENWESKIYLNTIRHEMDDSQRPDVPIRMDMPGRSDTYGFYSQARHGNENHRWFFKWDGFYNKSLAEMTMYPSDISEPSMFMLTWPDVRTLNSGIYLEDKMILDKAFLKFSGRLGFHRNSIEDEFGRNSLEIFYPDLEKSKIRILKSLSVQYHNMWQDFHLEGGLSYGERAPSVSEGYGFYLFNSFDKYDYIGNVYLKTEAALEGNLSLSLKKKNLKVGGEVNYFYVMNYIIGKTASSLSPMTIGAEGVKIYQNIDDARLYNLSLFTKVSLLPELEWNGRISYHRGKDNMGENLPLMSPVVYTSSLDFLKRTFSASVSMDGAGKQRHYNPHYGETRAEAYTVFNANFGKRFLLSENDLYLKVGVENIFDVHYSTYTDWNNIPRMGRNFYLSAGYTFN